MVGLKPTLSWSVQWIKVSHIFTACTHVSTEYTDNDKTNGDRSVETTDEKIDNIIDKIMAIGDVVHLKSLKYRND